MKFFKKLAIACLSLTLLAGFAVLASCGDNTDNSADNSVSNSQSESSASSDSTQTEAFKFRVLKADGSPAVGYVVQLCNKTCAFSAETDANGEVSFAGGDGEVAYEIHVFSALPQNGGKNVAHTGATSTPAEYGNDVIVLTLND